jgi:hypothetical protein
MTKIVFSTTFAGGADKSESAPATRLEPSTAETLQGLHPQCEYWAKGVDREKLPQTICTVTWGERRGDLTYGFLADWRRRYPHPERTGRIKRESQGLHFLQDLKQQRISFPARL